MLPQQNRLKKKKDFDRVFKKGKSVKEGFLFLKYLTTSLPESRFAFSIGKKVSKKAVVRNKLRRLLREVVRSKLPQLKKSVDGIFVSHLGLEKNKLEEIDSMINKVFKKINLI